MERVEGVGAFPAEGLLGDGDPGAVDGAVQRPELLDGRPHGRLHALLVGDVGLDEAGFRARLALEVGDDDARAGVPEHLGGRGAEAGAAAGHEEGAIPYLQFLPPWLRVHGPRHGVPGPVGQEAPEQDKEVGRWRDGVTGPGPGDGYRPLYRLRHRLGAAAELQKWAPLVVVP